MKVANLAGEEIPQVYAACGRGARSSLRVLRPGLAVTEMAVSPLPGQPTAVWTIRRSVADEHDAYIVVSFSNATLVLRWGGGGELAWVGRRGRGWGGWDGRAGGRGGAWTAALCALRHPPPSPAAALAPGQPGLTPSPLPALPPRPCAPAASARPWRR